MSKMVTLEAIGEKAECTQCEPAAAILRLPRDVALEEALARLDVSAAQKFRGLDLSMLRHGVSTELVRKILSFCSALRPDGGELSLAHNDLGSGTDCEQRLFDLTAEQRLRESEKVFFEKMKRDSSQEKDFGVAAAKRRKGQEGIDASAARMAAIAEELCDLETVKAQTPWYVFFSGLEVGDRNTIRYLDLSNCGLHASGLVLLTQVLLELEHRAEGEKVSCLSLDGNDLGDPGMASLASFLRLSGAMEALQLRNVGITEQGVSQVVAGLVTNRSLRLLDLRCNGLCSLEAGNAAISGVKRFNPTAEILLS